MNVPKLSVIIPFYNASQFLRRSLDSVMKQTFKDIEVISWSMMEVPTTLKILRLNTWIALYL